MSCFTTRNEWLLLSMKTQDQRFGAAPTTGRNNDTFLYTNFGMAVYNWSTVEYALLASGPSDGQTLTQTNTIPAIGPTTGPVIMQYNCMTAERT